MQTRSSQNSVLGKRTHQVDGGLSSAVEASASSQCLLTPEMTPKSKRARLSDVFVDGNSNKENIPPFRCDVSGDVSPTTPSSVRLLRRVVVSPQRTRSVSALSTPPPDSPLPVYSRARALLRATCNSATPIAGRTAERDTIVKFIEGAKSASCDDSRNSSLFISGSPGTGKTALVNSVLVDIGANCGDLEVVSVNCMTFQNVDTLWQRVCESLTRSGHVPRNGTLKGRRLLDKLLASRQKKCLLVLDELDHIASSTNALSTIFSLSQKHATIIRIIGIANTHTLTSTSLSSNEANVHTLHFTAYTSTQLLEVLRARLAPLYANDLSSDSEEQVQKILPTGTLTLLCKKVASQTGDVRTLFEVLRGALDIAVSSGRKEENPMASPTPVITPSHVLSALKAYMPANGVTRCNTTPSDSLSYNSEIVTKICNLGLQARLVLLSAVLACKRIDAALPLSCPSSPIKTIKRTGSASLSSRASGLELAQLHAYYSTILTRADNQVFAPVSRSEFSDVIGVLETSGLVSSSTSLEAVTSPSKSGRRGFGRSSSFGGNTKGAAAGRDIKVMDDIRVDEILRGLGISGTSAQTPDPLEEEVTAIWVRESARIARDLKNSSRAEAELGRSSDDTFGGAFQC